MKKGFSVFLGLVMLLSFFVPIDFECIAAAGSKDNAGASSYSVYSAGDYTGGVAESALSADEYYDSASSVANTVLSAGGEYCESIDEAAAILRKGMAAWQTDTINVYYKAKTYLRSYYSQIISAALEHTGTPTEGDYLKWSYSGYSVNWTYSKENGYYYISFFYNISYYTTSAQEKELTSAVSALASSLKLSSLTDYERVFAIYDYICQNVEYDYANLYNSSYKLKFTAYAALIDKTAVCQGIAVLIYRLCNMYDIDCRVITSIDHAWNIVRLDGYYYNLDATWDLGNDEYEYFLKCSADFSGHTRESEYTTDSFNSTYVMGTSNYEAAGRTLSNCTITLSAGSYLYNGSAKTPSVTVKYNSETLKASSDYTVSYANNIKVGTASVTITGKGNYSGSAARTFTIYETSHTWDSGVVTVAATCTETGVMTYTCKGCDTTKTAEIAAPGHSWNKGAVTKTATCANTGVKTYTCTACKATKTEKIDKTTKHNWGDPEFTTKATTNKNGVATYTCEVCGKTKTKSYAKIKSVTLSSSSYTYNGSPKTPKVIVKNADGSTISSDYYTVTYINRSSGYTTPQMKSVGKYYVKIKFKDKYSGTVKKSVTIKPKATSIKKITAKSKGFTVKWGEVTTKTTGYQVQYSTDKSFSQKSTKTIQDNTKTSKTITGLKAGKKYYVRIRTYKTVKVDGKSAKVYSSWSDTKTVTTKK